jgi:SNF2 family DNA or RNA helicase
MMSGTLPHNVWHNFSGYLTPRKNYPFDTYSKFLHTFSSWDTDGQTYTPDAAGITLLQKFLQAVLIARPKSILKLKNCDQRRFAFPLLESTATFVSKLTADYEDASVKAVLQYKTTTGDDNNDIHHLASAVKAQLASLHPMLCEELDKGNIGVGDDENEAQGTGQRAKVEEHDTDKSRAAYRQRIKARKDLCKDSGRISWFLRLWFMQETRPDKHIAIFSRFLSWLGIIDEALLRVEKIEALRLDGTPSQKKRQQVERAFLNGDADMPLLISSGVGKPLPSECRKLQITITNGLRRWGT